MWRGLGETIRKSCGNGIVTAMDNMEGKLEKAYKGCLFSMLLAVVLALAFLLFGCTTERIVTVERVRTDTTFITKQQRDSIWLHDSVKVSEKGDTVRIEKWHTKYVERLVHDTLYKSKTDSIPVPYPVVKEVEKKLSATQKGLMTVGLLSLMAAVIGIFVKLKRYLP